MFSHFSETRSMKSSRRFPSILSLEWTLSEIYCSDVWNQFSDKILAYLYVAILWHLGYKWILSPLLIVLFEISRSYLWRRSSLHADFAGFLKRTNEAVKQVVIWVLFWLPTKLTKLSEHLACQAEPRRLLSPFSKFVLTDLLVHKSSFARSSWLAAAENTSTMERQQNNNNTWTAREMRSGQRTRFVRENTCGETPLAQWQVDTSKVPKYLFLEAGLTQASWHAQMRKQSRVTKCQVVTRNANGYIHCTFKLTVTVGLIRHMKQ